ncbi:hypothetical protein NOMA109596_18860 [Nocardioides marinus]
MWTSAFCTSIWWSWSGPPVTTGSTVAVMVTVREAPAVRLDHSQVTVSWDSVHGEPAETNVTPSGSTSVSFTESAVWPPLFCTVMV